MATGFVPLNKSIKCLPEFLENSDIMDKLGLYNYDFNVADNFLSVSGELVYLDDFSFEIITGISIAFFNEDYLTVLPFIVEMVPQFKLTIPLLSLSLLIEYDFLTPVQWINNQWVVKEGPVELKFQSLGLTFELDKKIELNTSNNPIITLDAIQLGSTGLIVQLEGITPCFSEHQTIPGVPPNFEGVVINNATLCFPASLVLDNANSTGVVKGSNLLIGSTGFSGIVSLTKIDPGSPGPALLKFNIGKAEMTITEFSLTFFENDITESNITGTLIIPAFKDKDNNPVPINIEVTFGDGFKIKAKIPTPITALNKSGIIEVKLDALEIGKLGDNWSFGLDGSILSKTGIPRIEKIFAKKLIHN
jgi:hypothetical protein